LALRRSSFLWRLRGSRAIDWSSVKMKRGILHSGRRRYRFRIIAFAGPQGNPRGPPICPGRRGRLGRRAEKGRAPRGSVKLPRKLRARLRVNLRIARWICAAARVPIPFFDELPAPPQPSSSAGRGTWSLDPESCEYRTLGRIHDQREADRRGQNAGHNKNRHRRHENSTDRKGRGDQDVGDR